MDIIRTIKTEGGSRREGKNKLAGRSNVPMLPETALCIKPENTVLTLNTEKEIFP